MKTYSFSYFFLVFIACLFCFSPIYGQQLSDKEKAAMDEKIKGFDFYFNGGMYLGNKFTASYYNGISNTDEVSIQRVLGNTYYKQSIDDLIEDKQDIILDDEGIQLSEIDKNMRYNVSFLFGIGVLYHLNRNFALSISFSQARLTTIGGVTFTYNSGVPGNERSQILEYNLVGKEIRNFFEFGMTYTIRSYKHILPFFELAAQVNNVKVQSADLVIENSNYTMMDIYAGQTYVPNSGLTEIEPYLGGSGGGVMGGFGVRIPFSKSIALEPVFQLQYTFINLAVNDLKKMMPNYNLMVRIIVGDKIFAK